MKTTLNLSEIITNISNNKKNYIELKTAYLDQKASLFRELEQLETLKKLALDSNINIVLVQIAESILDILGDITALDINEIAALKIAKGGLRRGYVGNKQYQSFHQRADNDYGYGPKHGSIVERIGLKPEYRVVELSDKEKDACIYYLLNYSKIKEITNK